MRQRRITQREVLIVSMSMFIVVVLWVAFNVFHTWVTSTVSKDLEIQIIPIEPKFDVETLNNLKDRRKVKPIFELTNQNPTPTTTQSEPTPTIGIPTPTEEILSPTEEPIPTDTPVP